MTRLLLLACLAAGCGCGKHDPREMCGWDVLLLLLSVGVALGIMRAMRPRDPFTGEPRHPDSFPGD